MAASSHVSVCSSRVPRPRSPTMAAQDRAFHRFPSVRPPHIVVISEIPTPYRLPLYRALAARDDLDLEVVFCAAAQPDRPWQLDDALAHVPHAVLPGRSVTFHRSTSTFVYEINPGIVRFLLERAPDLIVIGGYAVFAEQAAVLLSRLRGIPYVIHSESHMLKPRGAATRMLKRAILPQIVSRASAGLAAGSAAARYLESYGLDAGRIRVFPNTIDVAAYREKADAARANADAVRARRKLPTRFHLYAGRLIEVKGVGDLRDAVALLGADAPSVVVAGTGPLEQELAAMPGIDLVGFQQTDDLIELLALADAVVVPSQSEPWGVTVNEALACGTPVIVSDAVGAAEDLVRDGVNGIVFAAGDVAALAAALTSSLPSFDPRRGPISRWDYALGVDQFVSAVRLALPGRLASERNL